MADFGIEAIEVYFPREYVDQEELETHYGVSKGKYTIGLGQKKMSFAGDREDVNTIAMTVLHNLVENNGIKWEDIGRLEVGTETLIDKSKSCKTWLMNLFKESGNHDIEGITSINACYGGTNALFNTLNWMESKAWDGRYGVVVWADLAVYEPGPARATGGAGAVAILIGPDPKLVIESEVRSTFMDNQYDFYKPNPQSEYPTVIGALSQASYLNALDKTYEGIKRKSKRFGKEKINWSDTDYFCFHSPYAKLVQKSFTRLFWNDIMDGSVIPSEKLKTLMEENKFVYENTQIQKQLVAETKDLWSWKVNKSLYLSKNCGNSYTSSIFFGLTSLIYDSTIDLTGKRILMFSYGSGCAASMYTIVGRGNYEDLRVNSSDSLEQRLLDRIKKTPIEFEECLKNREDHYLINDYSPSDRIDILYPGTYYLEKVDKNWRRFYARKEAIVVKIELSKPKLIPIDSQKWKVFALSRI